MKAKLLCLLLLPLAMGWWASCSNDVDAWEDGNHRVLKKKSTSKVYKMRLSLGGDFITEYDEPMRSGESPEGDTFIGINIFRTKKEAGAKEEKFGYGVYKYDISSENNKFDKANTAVEIDLLSDYTYRFETTVLTEWIDKLAIKKTSGDAYSYPFLVKSKNNSGEGSDMLLGKLGVMNYTYNLTNNDGSLISDAERSCLPYLKDGKAFVNAGQDWFYSSSPGRFFYPRLKRYYGELKDFDPEAAASDGSVVNATIDVAYQCFGVKIIVVDLPLKTKLKVKDKREPDKRSEYPNEQNYLLFPQNLVFEHVNTDGLTPEQVLAQELSFESLYSLKDLWTVEEMNDDNIDKKVRFSLKFEWDRGGNAIETFESKEIEVKPQTRKVIKVSVEGVANSERKGNLKVNFVDLDETLEDDPLEEVVSNSTSK